MVYSKISHQKARNRSFSYLLFSFSHRSCQVCHWLSRIFPFCSEFLALLFASSPEAFVSCFLTSLHPSRMVCFVRCKSEHVIIFSFVEWLLVVFTGWSLHPSPPISTPLYPLILRSSLSTLSSFCMVLSYLEGLAISPPCVSSAPFPSWSSCWLFNPQAWSKYPHHHLLPSSPWPLHKELCEPLLCPLNFLYALEKKHLKARICLIYHFLTAFSICWLYK